MPNRYLRSSYIESEAVNSIPLEAEVFWTHLLVTVDDFGRYDASTKILRPKLFPLRLDQVSEQDIKEWIVLCDAAGLIKTYVVAGKPYLQMQKWEQGRASFSKFPQPPTSADGCEQMFTAANKCLPPHLSPTPTPTPTPNNNIDIGSVELGEGLLDTPVLRRKVVKVEPPTLDAVLVRAAEIGCPAIEATKFFWHFDSSNWTDRNGLKIVRWKSKLNYWLANVGSRSSPKTGRRPEQNQIQEELKVRSL